MPIHRSSRFASSFLALAVAAAPLAAQTPRKYTADLASLRTQTVPAWFDDAKLGIFIDWGLYSVPGWATLAHPGSDFAGPDYLINSPTRSGTTTRCASPVRRPRPISASTSEMATDANAGPDAKPDVRFTHKAQFTYAILLKKPTASAVTVANLTLKPKTAAKLLGFAAPIPWHADGPNTTLTLPATLPSNYATLLRLETAP